MLNIIIIGAGKLGCHVASVLSKENHNITLVDLDPNLLHSVSDTMDVATKGGSGTDWRLLEDLLELSPDVLIALTGSEETNLVACEIAKHLRYPRTIARVRHSSYLNNARLDFGRIFDVDYLVAPELLAAHDILKDILNPGALFVENFAHGALQARTLMIPTDWHCKDSRLKHFKLPENIIVGLIRRELKEEAGNSKSKFPVKEVIFPHGDDAILPGDEVTFIGATEAVGEIPALFKIPQSQVNSAVIAGGSIIAEHLARELVKRGIDVCIIEKNYARCSFLANELPNCTIMHHDATDIAFLQAEKIGNADILVACTDSDERNLLMALLGKEIECQDSLVVVNNSDYIPLVTRLGLRHTISPCISTTNHILSQLRFGKINSLVSLYENQAEIMEINVSLNSRIVGIPLSELGPHFPRDLLIVMIQNRGRIMIAHGNRIISPGDTVIVVTSPKHVDELAKIF